MDLTERANPGLHDHVLERAIATTPDRAARVLDIGCGTGALLVRFRGCGYTNLAGIDIAPPAAIPGVHFHALDLDDPRFPVDDGSVDLALAVEVLEHIENVGAFLAEIRRVLSPTGRLLLTTPNVHSVEARLRLLLLGQLKQFDSIGDPTHIYPVFSFPFNRLLARNGFRVEQRWGFPEDGTSPTSRDALQNLARLARLLGLRGDPDGDQLCLMLQRIEDQTTGERTRKDAELTAHY
jgi:SAM-dependent methyltransferase